MACRPLCVLVAVLLTACAGGEDTTQSSGFASGPVSATYPSSAGSQSVTSDASASEASSEPIRPDMGVAPTSGPQATSDATTGPSSDATTEPATSGPATGTTTGPMGPVCGDGAIEGAEECEGADLAGKDCAMLGFSGGTLSCAPNCTFDKTKCTSESCGDGTKNGGEECDCGQMGSPCSQAQLGVQTCQNLVSPNGTNYHGGTLTCGSPNSCLFNKSACTWCGDGVRNGPEACEGGDLGGASCQSLGFSSGTLKCSASCTHDTSGCQSIVCGNGQCQAGEDSCNCPGDCPDDPNSCSSCECGGGGGNCYCDDACLVFNDCCPNGPC